MRRLSVVGMVMLLLATVTANARSARTPLLHKNGTTLNKRYPHGLGRLGAHDSTSGDPVTNFKRSTRLCKLAISYNRGLDRDKADIAREKA